MTTIANRIVDLLWERADMKIAYDGKYLVWSGDRWQVWEEDDQIYPLYSGYNLDEALDELIEE